MRRLRLNFRDGKKWAETKAKEMVDIARIFDEDREKSKFEARESKNTNVVYRVAVEADAKIRFSDEIQRAKRERAEA